jgi:hypothetical protein
MVLKVTRNGTDWIDAPEGEGAAGPCWGFDTDTNTPVFRNPSGTWVDALGQPISIFGHVNFSTAKDSALVAAL